MTAWLGRSARVETEVAIALAVSWKPLVKSNVTAMTTVTSSRTWSWSGILDRDSLQPVGDLLALVHRVLEEVVDVLPLEELGGG